jgi:hypothetical protein
MLLHVAASNPLKTIKVMLVRRLPGALGRSPSRSSAQAPEKGA